MVNMQDGFDILAISFAANAISTDWGMSRAELGIVFSAGLFGMMIGAISLAALADKFGRKIITIVGLTLSGSGMLISMAAADLNILVFGRVITGIGVGGILASVNTLVSEYAGPKYRVAAVSFFQLGFPFGAFLSGFIAAYLLGLDGGAMASWRYVFAFGAFTSFFFIPFILLLPESTAFLANQGGAGALEKINIIQKKFGRAPLSALPQELKANKPSMAQSAAQLLSPRFRVSTLLIWTAFFLLLTTLYFLLSWTPKMIIDMGFTEADGNRGGRLINLAGMIGIVIIGVLGYKIRPALITSVYLLLVGLLLIIFSYVGQSLSAVILMVSLIGVFVHGSMIGLYSTVPSLYPTPLRASGTGWAIGLSRFGAVMGPALAGYLFDKGWSVQNVFALFALPAGLAALAAFGLWRAQKRRSDAALGFI